MSDMGKSKLIKVGEREVVCRELTVANARALIQAEGSGDLLKDALFVAARLGDLLLLTNLTADDIEEMYPSDLAQVLEGCRTVNPDFFGLLDRVSGRVSRA